VTAVARVPFAELQGEFERAFAALGLAPERTGYLARVLAENQRDGIHSHGLNRFAALAADLRAGRCDPAADPIQVGGRAGFEQWDGGGGLGIWNARIAMERAVALARVHGVGGVGLRHTNHWMRAGTYALQAADAGCLGVCWTNTLPLMPPWGSAQVRIGNNPLAIAVPREGGHLLADLAMSQYSRGRMEVAHRRGESLPVPGGYGPDGELTSDPGPILESRRLLPTGFWKGSALAVVLDAAATVLSGGLSTHEIGQQGAETRVSQVFLAIDLNALGDPAVLGAAVERIVGDLHEATPETVGGLVRYPGEGMLRARRESLAEGVWVDAAQYAALRTG
jgi:3-dehydro-L-gulonate 2-dehydrogenase